MVLRYPLFQKTKTFHTYTFRTKFSKTLHTLLRTEARVKSKFQNKNFFQTHKHKENNFENNEQVPKSPWITTDRKGANTFPFYNLPPVLRSISKKEFFCAFFLSLLDKIKVGGDSCLPRHFANTNAKHRPAFQKTVSSSHRITEPVTLLGSYKWGVP